MSRLPVDDFLNDELELDEAGRPVRTRKLKPRPQPARRLEEIVEPRYGSSANARLPFQLSVNATNEERAWIIEHLEPFFHAKVLTDVTRRVKGGKEANVYCCTGHPAFGQDLIAAKVYRPRQFRSLKNDAQYRQGRVVLNAEGQAVSARDWRLHKAIAGKTRKGWQAAQVSWLEYEYQTLLRLHEAGADVPRPLRRGSHVLLMAYMGDEEMPAPTLIDVSLPRAEAAALFERVLHNIGVMLAHGWVHGDLSAYNILYWQGAITLIDFPQVVDRHANPDARSLFRRDVERVCGYFARYGMRTNPRAIAYDLWQRHPAEKPQAPPA